MTAVTHRLALGLAVLVASGCSAVTSGNVARTAPSTTAPPPPATVTVGSLTPVEGAPDRARVPADRRVFVLGDSLTEGAEPWLDDAVEARGWTLTAVDAEVGRTVPAGLAVLRRRARSLPPTVVVALGTNNLGASATEIDGWLASARRIVGADRRLVWVNVSVAGSPGRLARGREINAALARAGRRWDVDILDWDGWARRNRVTTRADGIHYEQGAYRLRALFYAGALPRPTAP